MRIFTEMICCESLATIYSTLLFNLESYPNWALYPNYKTTVFRTKCGSYLVAKIIFMHFMYLYVTTMKTPALRTSNATFVCGWLQPLSLLSLPKRQIYPAVSNSACAKHVYFSIFFSKVKQLQASPLLSFYGGHFSHHSSPTNQKHSECPNPQQRWNCFEDQI